MLIIKMEDLWQDSTLASSPSLEDPCPKGHKKSTRVGTLQVSIFPWRNDRNQCQCNEVSQNRPMFDSQIKTAAMWNIIVIWTSMSFWKIPLVFCSAFCLLRDPNNVSQLLTFTAQCLLDIHELPQKETPKPNPSFMFVMFLSDFHQQNPENLWHWTCSVVFCWPKQVNRLNQHYQGIVCSPPKPKKKKNISQVPRSKLLHPKGQWENHHVKGIGDNALAAASWWILWDPYGGRSQLWINKYIPEN